MTGQQVDIFPGMPDALSKVPPKAREYEGMTLDEAVTKAHSLVDEVLNLYGPEYVLLLYSGGEDSVVLAHLMRERASVMTHVNTGFGIPDTAQHVREMAAAWNVELLEPSPPRSYEDLVLGKVLSTRGANIGRQVWKGFPGPASHGVMYQRLKERALDKVRKLLVGPRGRTGQIVQLAGMRWAESERRWRNTSEIDPRGARVWASPLAYWTNGHMSEYRTRFRCQLSHDHAPHMLCSPGGLPRNEVTAHLHKSGDCLCGAFAEDGEIFGLELFYPDAAARIHDLERQALAQGDIPPPALQVGLGGWPGEAVGRWPDVLGLPRSAGHHGTARLRRHGGRVMCQRMSAAEIQSLNFMNQEIWAKSEEEQERWYAGHPVEMYEAAAALHEDDDDPEAPGGAA